jgi:hypothetical protein
LKTLGPDVPLHFTAFHPDFKMLDVPATPPETPVRARQQALSAGFRHVYVGNIHDQENDSTYCASCGRVLIEREGMSLDATTLMSVAGVPSAMRDCQVASTQCPGSGDGDGYRFSSSVEEGH